MKPSSAIKIERAAWAPSIRIRKATTSKAKWKEILRGIEELEALDRDYSGHEVVVHKLLNLLNDGLVLLLGKASVVPASQRAAHIVSLAAACIARVPQRFRADTPFGAACCSAWTIGHQSYALHASTRKATWSAYLRKFEKSAEKFRNAPRTHAEARLKSTASVKALLVAGTDAPWCAEARALYGESR